MYLEFYNLTKAPFHITPDPEFLYMSPSHKEALASIIYGIEKRKGFVEITGSVGVGKTTILRSYLESADKEKLRIIYVFNSNVSFGNLLRTIFEDLDLPFETNDVFMMVNTLHHFLIEEFSRGRNVVLIIDEAQNMPVETLENLRMLSNLETSSDKLIQMVLIGQPELDERLNLHELRQLKQRIAIRAVIAPLSYEESLKYLRHRLKQAGDMAGAAFTPRALELVAKDAHGIPRLMNILCDNALITGFGADVKPVTPRIVEEIISDFSGKKGRSALRWVAATGAVVLVVVTGFFLASPYISTRPAPATPTEQSLEARPAVQKALVAPLPPPVQAVPEPKKAAISQKELPKEAQKAPAPVVTKVVKRGDNLSKMAKDVYGTTDAGVLEKVRQYNPGLKDVNLIKVDETITFPQAGKE